MEAIRSAFSALRKAIGSMMNQAALPETADSTEIERRNKEAAQAEGVATGAALVIIEEFAIDIHRIADALEKMAANVAAVRIDPA